MAESCYGNSTFGPFTASSLLTTLRGEQFWGRAVRHASHDSNRVWGVCVFRPNIARAPRHAIPFRSRAPEHLVNKYLIINQKRVIPKAARTLQRGEGSARKVRSCLQLKLPSCPPRVTPCPPWLKGSSGYHYSENSDATGVPLLPASNNASSRRPRGITRGRSGAASNSSPKPSPRVTPCPPWFKVLVVTTTRKIPMRLVSPTTLPASQECGGPPAASI